MVDATICKNLQIARVISKGKILVKFTYGKLLCLSNVLYLSSLNRNLVYGVLLNNVKLKAIVGYDQLLFIIIGSLLGRNS